MWDSGTGHYCMVRSRFKYLLKLLNQSLMLWRLCFLLAVISSLDDPKVRYFVNHLQSRRKGHTIIYQYHCVHAVNIIYLYLFRICILGI